MISTKQQQLDFIEEIRGLKLGMLAPYWPYEDEAPMEATRLLEEYANIQATFMNWAGFSAVIITIILCLL